MSFDLAKFGSKLHDYREQRQLTPADLADATGIAVGRYKGLEAGELLPTGDEVLIIADVFQCDYRFFVSNEKLAAFQQTETLYRKFGNEFTKNDRRSIQEFIFLCECEAFLLSELSKRRMEPFSFTPGGSFYKGHGEEAAKALRRHFSYGPHEVPLAMSIVTFGVWLPSVPPTTGELEHLRLDHTTPRGRHLYASELFGRHVSAEIYSCS